MSTINEKSVANMITDKKVYGPIYVDEALTWREIKKLKSLENGSMNLDAGLLLVLPLCLTLQHKLFILRILLIYGLMKVAIMFSWLCVKPFVKKNLFM